jgi:hypothetical protein
MYKIILDKALCRAQVATSLFVPNFPPGIKLPLSERKCFINAVYTHEQKGGINNLPLGHGSHVRILADMSQTGRRKVKRDIDSTMTRHSIAAIM